MFKVFLLIGTLKASVKPKLFCLRPQFISLKATPSYRGGRRTSLRGWRLYGCGSSIR
jgi:hypothetical protein